ncbi:SNF2-related protein [Cupriavidus basilensis]
MLIADDVGMGKTIEAGLILWPLLANRTVQRLLILAPAKLVNQWQQRLKKCSTSELRFTHPDLDTQKSDFWGIHPIVVASLPTLRSGSQRKARSPAGGTRVGYAHRRRGASSECGGGCGEDAGF